MYENKTVIKFKILGFKQKDFFSKYKLCNIIFKQHNKHLNMIVKIKIFQFILFKSIKEKIPKIKIPAWFFKDLNYFNATENVREYCVSSSISIG